MTVAKGLMYVVSLLLATVILLGFYILYRYTQTPTAADVARMHFSRNYAGVSPTICSASWSGFGGSAKVIVYIKNARGLQVLTNYDQGKSVTATLINADGKEYSWILDGAFDADSLARNTALASQQEAVTCNPWFFSDDSVFPEPPEGAAVE